MEDKVNHVVVDSGGFIRNAPLKDLGVRIYTIQDVVAEIRDKATRQRLQVLPYELIFREPSPEAIKIVTEFAKKTGDYRSLSAVDVRVMALTYQLEKEHMGTGHLKLTPQSQSTWMSTTKNLEKPTEIAGFYLEKKTPASSRTTSVSEGSTTVDHISHQMDSIGIEEETESADEKSQNNAETSQHNTVQIEVVDLLKSEVTDGETGGDTLDSNTKSANEGLQEGDVISSEQLEEDSDDDDDDEEENDEDDEGWITPKNIQAVKKSMGDVNSEKAAVVVGCLTTDFAMQNVLIQMGLNVISVDGMLIKRAKNYVLRCHGCMKITTQLHKEFCPHCGNKTLQKVSMIVHEDGSVQYCLSRRKPISTRGMRYSLPMPQGGKHATNPRLCEDQPIPQQRQAKQGKVKYDVMDPDYVSHNSPFAPNDVYSRSSKLGITGQKNTHSFQKRRNPNENRGKKSRRK